jgi:hypothetical protein
VRRERLLQPRPPAPEEGIALLLCVFSLLLLTGIAMGLMYMADTETRVDDNFRSSVQSYYGARAGLEEARDRMRTAAASPIPLPTQMPSLGGGVVYLVNTAGGADVVQPWNTANTYFDDELCQENYTGLGLASPGRGIACGSAPAGANWYNSVASTAPLANSTGAISYKWVRITLKGNGSLPPYYVNGSGAAATLATQVCWAPSNELLLAGGFASCPAMGQVDENVYMLTSLAVTPTGARRMLQMEATRLRLPAFPSALTMDGSGATYDSPTSNGFQISGVDKRSCGGSALPSLPGVGASDNSSVTAITGAIPGNRAVNYTGSGGTAPDVENLNSPPNTLAPQWQTVGGINSVDSLIDVAATQTYNGSVSGISLGTDAAPQITVVNGDLTLGGGASGSGILMVTGTLNLNGLVTFHGIVLVIGQGIVNVSGGGGGEFDGAFFVARTVDSSGNPLPDNSAPAAPLVNWAGGGGNGIYYDSCWVAKMANNFYYIPLNVRELPY